MTASEDLPTRIIGLRTAGGFLQTDDGVRALVYLEIDATTDNIDSEAVIHTVTHRLEMDLDVYFDFMAQLEHAGKVALMMPNLDLKRVPG